MVSESLHQQGFFLRFNKSTSGASIHGKILPPHTSAVVFSIRILSKEDNFGGGPYRGYPKWWYLL